jgi:hypothetical protein
MSKMNHYYDPPDSMNLIEAPGEVCNFCSDLSKTTPAGSLIVMPLDALHEEYSNEEGDIHAHLECARKARDEYKRLWDASCEAINNFVYYGGGNNGKVSKD